MSLKYSLLAILLREPKTGYQLSKEVDGSTGFFWSATHQQIYKELSELQKNDLIRYKEVEQTEKPDKKVYSTTKKGIEELKRWLREPTEPPANKDSFLIKLFVGSLIEPEVILEDLLRHKEIHQEKRQAYLEIEKKYFKDVEDLPVDLQFQYLTLRRGILLENSWHTWCKEVESFLNSKIKGAKNK